MTIEISNLTKVYGEGKSAVVALNELDLNLEESEVCIVRGPNGSGKTTLISILSGELEFTAGSISLTTGSGLKPKISVINQFHNLLDELTIKEHFEITGNFEHLKLVPFEILNLRPTEISRGQAQLAAVALALSPDTDVLLADEPTGALGAEDSQTVYEFIKEAATRNRTAVILVTHDINAEAIADRVVRLRDGRISETWKPNESERQVINDRGWVKLPHAVVDGLARTVEIAATSEGATLVGSRQAGNIQRHSLIKRTVTGSNIIQVKDLVARHGTFVVCADLNFHIKENELFCIFGKSGVGKTTVLKCLAGLHNNYQGQISKKDVLPYFNIENLFGLELSLEELKVDGQITELLQMRDLEKRQLKTLSGGQQQRALVAIALSATDPAIILDEPTSALDDDMAEMVMRAILESKKTIVLATHDDRLLAVSNTVLNL